MSRRKGAHFRFADYMDDGERVIICACGVEWRSADTGAVWASYWAHSQDPAHR